MQIISLSIDCEPCCRQSFAVHISRCGMLEGERKMLFTGTSGCFISDLRADLESSVL